ncbi:hypothetical protein PHLGIDRAFT_128964 [Phlebiopsis gigantea 11061_1 CR5-6]|uniref:Conserved oligomeric Golgi complex subunit 1 n=1 Tax=Phlebiopsis gigantea (strain 11061_1 CR5-6) TaxID=745531 RepID=A0A0C3S8H9_PHLG1|nr:hypothetical protein PHLGIDRAFT_128964 [Phlebiopsis gigantea 11061_1 CR5-6]
MARRPSTVSLSSVGSGSGLSKLTQLPPLPPLISRSSSKSLPNGSPTASRQVSINAQLELAKPGEVWDPDELFAKHTVAEVKVIQQRLHADADAKQEELRLMVGERYRDLLQASTSIISLARSSNNVVHALQEMRSVTSSIETNQGPEHLGLGQGDAHLHSLQSLAAHLKLLLDSSEHLWRLMEKKLYLHAAWLFLLSRVVHRSLLRHGADEDEDSGWQDLEIDIHEQFPLVQRQWEAISQFRSQIVHKATLSLRESALSSPEICAVLLALHLLESRPFTEALNTFLSQRTRCLATALARHKDRFANGNDSALDISSAHATSQDRRSRKTIVRDVRQKLKTVLNIISRTVGAARTVFISSSKEPPLMRRVLAHIQSPTPTTTEDLPPEVRLTSQTLLSSLPSSNHFLLLPPAIKSYKPYVDVESLSSQKEPRFSASLTEWFDNALEHVHSSITTWLSELTTVRELWDVRGWCREWLDADRDLKTSEKVSINGLVDLICRQRAVELWKTVLSSTEAAFRSRLKSALSELGEPAGQDSLDAQPTRYLLQLPPLSISPPSGPNASVPFQKYSNSLQQQIAGRTPLLQEVLDTVENRVQMLRDDLDTMHGQEEDTRALASQLVTDYRLDADALCKTLCDTLQSSLDDIETITDSSLRQILFVSRLADDLSSSAYLMTTIGCSPSTADDFRGRLKSIHDDIVQRWESHVVQMVTDDYSASITGGVDGSVSGGGRSCRPSTAIVHAILCLASHVQELGSLLDPTRVAHRAGQLLNSFTSQMLERLHGDSQLPASVKADVAQDLAVLDILLSAWGAQFTSTQSRLRQVATDLLNKADFDSVRAEVTSAVVKMQLLFGLLLPPSTSLADIRKPSGASKAGTHLAEVEYQTAVELVKPSARFGLLLVGSVPR